VNRKAQGSLEPAYRQRHDFDAPQLIPLLELDDEGFRERFRGSPVKRAKRVGLQRNVCVALGNIGAPSSVPALSRALSAPEALVRMHAAWALGRIGGPDALRALNEAVAREEDPEVLEEIHLALTELSPR
jgi:epoxyqueuosine reductase